MKRRLWYAGSAAALLLAGLATYVLHASRPGSRVEGCPEGCSAAGVPGDHVLRVMSLNVLHGFPTFKHLRERLDLIAGEIDSQGADVVLLQEVPWTLRIKSGAAYLARQTGLNFATLRANGNRHAILFEEGLVILSRYPLKDLGYTELEPRAGPFEHRVALRATVITPWGDVDVFVTHLTDKEPEVNLGQSASLRTFVMSTSKNPAIVAGDFNATDGSPQILSLAGEWTDVYRAANPGDEGLTCCVDDLAGGPAEPLERRIDYMFLVPDGRAAVRVRSAHLVLNRPSARGGSWLWPSDHAGIVADLEIGR